MNKDEPIHIDVFEAMNNLRPERVAEIVEIMSSSAEDRITSMQALEDPGQVGVFYAVYYKYVVDRRPYLVVKGDVSDLISTKMAIMAQALKDKLPREIVWALDSSLLSDITQEYMYSIVDQAELDEAIDPKVQAYPH